MIDSIPHTHKKSQTITRILTKTEYVSQCPSTICCTTHYDINKQDKQNKD
jgi:hypothetical protein